MTEDLLSLSFSSTSTLSDNNLISIPIFDPSQSHNNKKIYTIIGIGDPIVDIISEINADIITEHELKLGDSIFASEDCANKNIEMFNILENNRSVNYVPGGSVQNTLRVLSWNLINDYDLINTRETFQITMLGSVGDDQYKNKIINSLEDIGVNPLLEILPGDKTSRCGVGIYQKEKLFITQLRASKRLSEKFIENNFDKISEHQALLIEGYLIQNKFNIIEKLCNYFLAKNKKIIFTLSAKFIIEMHYEKLIRLANEADIIAGNMEEALALGGEEGKNIQEIFNNIFRKLKPKKNRIILITDGANGAFCAKYVKNKLEFILQCLAPKIEDEDIKDLNGAGDAFLGGFLSEYIKGNDLYDCCKKGINSATIILKNVGCTFPKKTSLLKI